MKAFIVTRVGDVFLAFALFILVQRAGHAEHPELMVLAPQKLAGRRYGDHLGYPDVAGRRGR
jgi:NADH:ubiquinone oxidoreductase subunit 5 (subunit L)/multisubunit Na+/H+ antiporter MnhA subunit